jgi:hypothetical protein
MSLTVGSPPILPFLSSPPSLSARHLPSHKTPSSPASYYDGHDHHILDTAPPTRPVPQLTPCCLLDIHPPAQTLLPDTHPPAVDTDGKLSLQDVTVAASHLQMNVEAAEVRIKRRLLHAHACNSHVLSPSCAQCCCNCCCGSRLLCLPPLAGTCATTARARFPLLSWATAAIRACFLPRVSSTRLVLLISGPPLRLTLLDLHPRWPRGTRPCLAAANS